MSAEVKSPTSVKINLSKISTVKSSLEDFSIALAKGYNSSSDQREQVYSEWFGTKARFSLDKYISKYENNKIQWIMKKYFESIGFEITKITDFTYDGEAEPTRILEECDIDATFAVFSEAVFFLYNKETKEKIAIRFSSSQSGPASGKIFIKFDASLPWDESVKVYKDWKTIADIESPYRGKKITCSCKFLRLEKVTWDDVIIEQSKKDVIRRNITKTIENQSLFKKFNMSIKRGIILKGPPGTGKTKICKAIANEVNCSVLYVLPGDFENGFGVRDMCLMAKDLAPCVLVLEDIDWIVKDRQKFTGAGFLAEFMNQLDGLEEFGDIITVGTTNMLEDIEDAVKNRPGRFDRVIDVGNPDQDIRKKMLIQFTKDCIVKGVNFDKIAESTDNLSGAHINDICKTSCMFAIEEGSFEKDDKGEPLGKIILTNALFKSAIKEIKTKDYSSYIEKQSINKRMGFGEEEPATLEDMNW